MAAKRKLCLLDPGLSSLTGHHAMIYTQLAVLEEHLYLYTHQAFNDPQHRVERTLPFFESDFYGMLASPISAESRQKTNQRLHFLAWEYKKSIEHAHSTASDNQPIQFILHSLAIMHLHAVWLALEALDTDLLAKSRFRLGVIYPWNDVEGVLHDHAFHALGEMTQVEIFAAEAELLESVKSCLPRAHIHPCCVLPEQAFQQCEQSKSTTRKNQVVCYLGDAKQEKGFLELADNMEKLAKGDSEIEWVAQFTITGHSQALIEQKEKLNNLSNRYSNVTICERWLADNELLRLIGESQGLVLNYRVPEYAYKNSGFIWLASWCETPVWLNKDTWLEREAERLGLAYAYVPNLLSSKVVLANIGKFRENEPREINSREYKANLFRPFKEWILAE